MKPTILLCAVALLLFACNKTVDNLVEKTINGKLQSRALSGAEVQYLIRQGDHSSTGNSYYAPVALNELKFSVRFDSSAIYKASIPLNQLDINKLYGFSDNNALHHEFSARFGWRWSEGALRLFAYVYNNGTIVSEELGAVAIGKNIACALRVAGEHYEFEVAGKTTIVPRASTTPMGKGYLLYPYFGGDEVAPHDIRIWIRNL